MEENSIPGLPICCELADAVSVAHIKSNTIAFTMYKKLSVSALSASVLLYLPLHITVQKYFPMFWQNSSNFN